MTQVVRLYQWPKYPNLVGSLAISWNPHGFNYKTLLYYISTEIYSDQAHQIKIVSLWREAISCSVPCFPRIMFSRFADINSVEQFIEDQENESTRKNTQKNVALLKEFLTLRNESRLIWKKFSRRSWVRDFFVFCGQLTVIESYKHL